SLGCKWDSEARGWWAASNHKNIDKMQAAYAEAMGWIDEEVEVFEFEKDSQAIDQLKKLGAAWDSERFAWIAPKSSENIDKMRQAVADAVARAEAKAKLHAERGEEI